MKAKHKRIYVYFVTVMLALLIMASAVLSYAYFSKKDIYDGYLSGEIELLFDRLDDTGLASYGAAEGITADKEQTWGTKNNPYVISNVRHLYNLSELQNIGYFDKQFISKNYDENGNLVADPTNIPYFIICEPDYTPVLIDGSSFKEIASIGNDEHPFIGSVKGVHIKTKDENGETINKDQMVTVGTNTSATSVIHNVKVKSNPANVDSGLFGYVSFIGDLPEESDENQTFIGTPSVISNIVLSDVQVEVNSSFWDTVTEFVKDIALGEGGHRFSFTDLFNAKDANGNALDIYNSVPHENHHIGILAGHISYSTVEYISVYYSNDNVVAIDLTDATEVTTEDSEGNEIKTKANYLSATGIIGFIYNLNPTVNEDGSMTAGSGDSFSNLSYSMVGGGGEAVGDKAGYILAKNIFNKYTHIANGETLTENSSETIKISTATTSKGIPLCYPSVRDMGILGEQVGYYFYDGVFTFALSSDNDVIEPTWEGEVDKFSIGSTDPENWVTNYTEGNKAVAAYLEKVTSDKDLQDAIDANLPIFILRETDATSAFLMSLYNQSTASTSTNNFNEKYTTNGTSQEYGDQEFINSLVESYYGESSDKFIEGLEIYDSTMNKNEKAAEIMSALKNGEEGWKVINVGISSSGLSIDTLRHQYKINPAQISEKYSYFTGNVPVAVNETDRTIADYYLYDYDKIEYAGYFYYTVEEKYSFPWWYDFYTYYWQDKNGNVIEVKSESRTTPDDYFDEVTGKTWANDERIYTNGTYTGVVINATTGKFDPSGNTANMSGPILTKSVNTTLKYFYKPVGSEHYYYADDTSRSNPHTEAQLTATADTSTSGTPIFKSKQNQSWVGVKVDQYYTYTFSANGSSGTNMLRMIKADFTVRGTHYTIWNGTDSAAQTSSNFQLPAIGDWIQTNASSLSNSTSATVKFNDDGTCYISYVIGSVSQYINYNGSAFNGSMSNSVAGTKLCIYVLQGTQDINYGRVTYDPQSGTGGIQFNANEHVLYATTNGDTTSYEVMDVTKLPNLGNSEMVGWKSGNAADGENGLLSSKDLVKKFSTEKGIQFGAVLNIGNWQLGTNGMITAPVGKLGTYADIPLSCVAFRINKEGTQHIRVIISVSVSEYYVGEDGVDNPNILDESTRYFNLWQINESGSEMLGLFTKNSAVERFEIPRSFPYKPGTISTEYTGELEGFYTVQYNGQDYGMYMNGDRILVAHEFTVSEVGLYILGPSGFNFDSNGFMENFEGPDVPMEIVYFSADGVASSGRDGASASQIGSIDYVYDFGGEIITVTDTSENGEDDKENYSTYYPSYCLTYFENTKVLVDEQFVSINNEQVKIRRYVADKVPPTSSQGFAQMSYLTSIKYTLGGDKYANIVQYSRFCDNVETNKNEETAE
jgi:hypothetical protein